MNSGRVLVETLGDDEWTVIAVDGRPVQWRSVVRVLPAVVQPIFVRAHRRGERVFTQVPASAFGDGAGDMTVAVTPVFGPGHRVHGVQVCYAPAESSLPLPYPVAAFDYMSDQRSIHLMESPFGWNLPDSRVTWTVPEAFRYVERFDGAMDLILQTLDPAEGLRWAGDVTARVGEAARRYRLVLRGGAGADRTRLRGLLLDLTESLAPEPASFDQVTLAALGRAHTGHSYLALADVRDVRVIRWITDPVPDVQWQGTVDDRSTSHPDDVVRVRAELDRLVREGLSRGSFENIRMRRVGGGWVVVNAVSTIVPGVEPPVLLLTEITVVGYSDEPDPTEPGPAAA
jgi:hypothetical protein